MDADLKLMEACRGVGALKTSRRTYTGVGYEISRYQGIGASGMPVPGLLRIEGRVDLSSVEDGAALVGSSLTLTLADGRALGVTLADEDGRVLTEGHGPSRCRCC